MGNCFGLCRDRPETYATMVASESITAEPSLAGIEEEAVVREQTFDSHAQPCFQNDAVEEASEVDFITHPFLCQDALMSVLQTMKVMFIMRGAPGSGKSTLAGVIQQRYPAAVVCSADHFWVTPDGEYRFDASRLKEAHNSCQNAAYRACQSGEPQIIIDNTNVRRWEFKYYSDLANRFGYLVLFVEPNTPWRLDAEELFARGRHDVPMNAIVMKIKSYEALPVPSYFGWFLTPASCKELRNRTQAALTMLQSQPEVLAQSLLPTNVNLTEFFSWIVQSHHVTAKFCDRGRLPQSAAYSETARSHVPEVFALRVYALLVTPRVVAAAVGPLEGDALALWDNGDDPNLPKGAKAHVTLGTAPRVRPVQAGEDLVQLLLSLQRGDLKRLADWSSGELWGSSSPEEGCLLQLKQPLWLDTVFGHFQ